MNEITYKGSFEKFVFQIGVVFRVGVNRRLYALKPGVEQDEKVRITNKAELEEIFKYIDENEEFMDALQVLYVYPEDLTPQSSPAKTPIPIVEEKEKSDSVKSDRSTYQKRFAREVARRDVFCCFDWSSHRRRRGQVDSG